MGFIGYARTFKQTNRDCYYVCIDIYINILQIIILFHEVIRFDLILIIPIVGGV